MSFVRLALIFLGLWLLAGCHLQPRYKMGLKAVHPSLTAGFVPPPATWEECTGIDKRVVGWTATGVVLGVLGGGAGVTTAFFDDTTPRYVTGTISVVFGAMTALASYLSVASSKKYADRCTDNQGGR